MLAALTAICAQHRYAVLAESPTPTGIDGYYYALQLRSIVEHGSLAYRDFPLAFYLMAPFALITDAIVGAKLASAILGALAVVPSYAIAARLGRSRLAGLLAAILVGTSAGGSYLAMEFVKNGIGITVALFAIWLGLRACEAPTRSRLIAAGVGVVAAMLTHKVAGALVLVIAVPAGLAVLADRGLLFGRRLVVCVVTLVALIFFGIVALGQLGLFANMLASDPWWSAPALVQGDTVILPMGYEPLIGLVVGLAAAALLLAKRTASLSRPERCAAWSFVMLAIVIGFPFLDVSDPQGLGMRLRTIAFVPMALCAAICVGALGAPLHRVPIIRRLAVSLVAIITFLAMPARRADGLVVPHPAMISAVLSLTNRVPAGDTVIVPERQIMFMVPWYTHIAAQLTPAGVAPAHRWRALTAAFIQLGSPLDRALLAARARPAPPIGLHALAPDGFVLVPESTWAAVVSTLPAEDKQRAASWPTI
ncbi:hypothetical protein BH11MYX2_BH11MYX2_35550 [soil metagenome]